MNNNSSLINIFSILLIIFIFNYLIKKIIKEKFVNKSNLYVVITPTGI